MARLTIFAALLALVSATAAAVWLLGDRPDGVASRVLAPQAFVETLPPKKKSCVPYQIVPPGTRAVQMTLGTFGRPVPASVSVVGLGRGREVFSGARDFRENQNVDVPISPSYPVERVVELCLRNTGRHALQIGGQPDIGLSIRFLGSRRSTWADSAETLATRFSVGRVAPFGSSTLWVALSLALLAVGAAVALVIRLGSRS